MKSIAAVICLFVAVNLATALPSPFPPIVGDGWEKLGDRNVDFTLDKDVIFVTGIQGQFTALKLKSKAGAIKITKIVVHFGNGTEQVLDTPNEVANGKESKVFDLVGDDRTINRVEFWYDTKGYAGKKAEIELWGKR